MDLRARKAEVDRAERDIQIGWGTGIGIVLLRAMVLIGFFVGETPLELGLLAQLGAQLLLAAAFAYGVYRRHAWAAVGLLLLWGLGYFYSWYMLGRVLPPLGIIGVLVWYGLYRGLRGVRALAALQAGGAPAVP